MSLAKGVLGALVGGAIGGAIWAGAAYFSGWELSLLAIVVGGAAGFGMGMGNKGRGGAMAGVLAACVTVACIFGAKFGMAELRAEKMIESTPGVTEEDARTALMDSVYAEFEDEGMDMTEPQDAAGYPPEVWNEADRRWHAMSPREHETFRAGLEMEKLAGVEQASGLRFGIFDIVCLVLAISTAFKTASTRVANDEGEVIDETAAAPAMLRVAEAEAASVAPVAAEPPAVAPNPVRAAPARTESSPSVPAGLGIFSMLGKEPASAPRSILAPDSEASVPAQASPSSAPAEQVGLINLDLGDERKAA